jgi:protein-L-isoaspartate(D-aspartate) O-methyltransferase
VCPVAREASDWRFTFKMPIASRSSVPVEKQSQSDLTEVSMTPSEHNALLEQLQAAGVTDPRVLNAIRAVPRDRFVPLDQRGRAWCNVALPIACEQTISQPLIVGLMVQALELTGCERVLEIGTGSGYHAAILAQCAGEVITVERHPRLSVSARRLLRELQINNVEVVCADGCLGWPPRAPYDAISIAAGTPKIPAALREQLAEHGRMVLPLGETGHQQLVCVTRVAGEWSSRTICACRFVPLIAGTPSQTILRPEARPEDDGPDDDCDDDEESSSGW